MHMRINEIIAYHGSAPRDTTGFALSHTGHNAHTFGVYEAERHGIFFTTNPKFAELYGDVEKYELFVKNTANLDKSNILDVFIDNLRERNRNLAVEATNLHHTWQFFEDELGEEFVMFLKSNGYDSAMFVEYNDDGSGNEIESQTIVVLDPSKIVKNKQMQLEI